MQLSMCVLRRALESGFSIKDSSRLGTRRRRDVDVGLQLNYDPSALRFAAVVFKALLV